MAAFSEDFLALRVFVSCLGLVGNVFLIISILRIKLSRVKSFELFLLGLASANLEEIIIINIYETIILQTSSVPIGTWSCRVLKFLTVFGEITSILFTVLISIFRYQKLSDVSKRANLPIYLDNLGSACMMSGVCVALSSLFSLPIFVMNLQGSAGNVTRISSGCPPDFFQCNKNNCPILNRLYKYVFMLVCHLVPLIIVTVTGCLILTVLLSQRKKVIPIDSVSGSRQIGKTSKDTRFQRSTVAVLAAMGLFQVDWTFYLILQLTLSQTDVPFWAEIEFFISTSYTSISPYVYGVGNNLFSLKNFLKK
ncbi:gonadotropin-releasing hormone receptor [Mugil cephalus]|uniref:gonadotropin-releasing hormone receptor n=1 Tax=Mugil cephalus TaxID=48193 RepID=UPI001FB58C49|nr:gonadotropin-releasing hormone receptor [Mugil cephalus]